VTLWPGLARTSDLSGELAPASRSQRSSGTNPCAMSAAMVVGEQPAVEGAVRLGLER
jgi:hypothetical protein